MPLLALLLSCTPVPPGPELPTERPESSHPGHWARMDNLNFGHAQLVLVQLHSSAVPPPSGASQTGSSQPGISQTGQLSMAPQPAGLLIFGGYTPKVERYDPESGHTLSLQDAPEARLGASAASVHQRALVLGGALADGSLAQSSLLFEQGALVLGPGLLTPRSGAATVLHQERALTCGGLGVRDAGGAMEPLGSCEWHDSRQAEPGPSMPSEREGLRMVLMDGAPVVVGGRGPEPREIWRLQDNIWTKMASLEQERWDHQVVVLDQGLLVIGGRDAHGALDSVELCTLSGCESAGTLSEPRSSLGAGLLGDGRVVVFGGTPLPDSPDALSSRTVDLYQDGEWTMGGRAGQARSGAATREMPDGTLLIVGGTNRKKLVNSVSTFSPLDKPPRQSAEPTSEPDQAPAATVER